MSSDEFIDSVEDLIARHLSGDASMRFVERKTGKIGRDGIFEEVVYCALRSAMEQARQQMAIPRIGTMTFEQAMEAVDKGKMVTRVGWGILHALLRWGHDNELMFWRLDNLEGSSSGSGSPYDPSDEDRAATDWMQYQRPEIDLWVNYDD